MMVRVAAHYSLLTMATHYLLLTPLWQVFVVMMVGGGRGIGNVISKLQTAHPDAAIIGGVATGRWLVRAHAHRLEYVRNGVVGLMFRGNVPLTALVCSGSPLAQLRDAKRELHEQNKALLGGLLFTCTARDEEEDANAFATTFPQAPLVGLPCGGEIGPAARRGPATGLATQKGSARLQGFTAVYGLFAVPVRSRAAPLHVADLSTAYAAARARPAAVAAAAATVAAAELCAKEALAKAEGRTEEEEEDDEDEDEDEDGEEDDGWSDDDEEEEEEGEGEGEELEEID